MTTASKGGNAILVTGITGLIGSELADRLWRDGRNVIGMDKTAPTGLPYPVLTHDLPDSHRWHEAIVQYGVTKIVHAGGVSGPMLLQDAPAKLCDINLVSLVDLLEAARIHRIQRVVWFSSIMAYGDRPGTAPVTEDVPLYPTTVYGATKAAGEALLNGYFHEHGVDAVALRVASCYGPGRTTSCLIRTLVQDAMAKRQTVIRDEPGRTRQHIYVDDVISGIIGALDADRLSQRAYNIGPGESQSLDSIIRQVQAVLPDVSVRVDPDGMGWNTFGVGPLSIDAARRDFGFEPEVDLTEGATRVRDALRAGVEPGG